MLLLESFRAHFLVFFILSLKLPIWCNKKRSKKSHTLLDPEHQGTFSSKKARDLDMVSPVYRDDESGYASGSSSDSSIPEVYFTKPHLKFLNRQLQNLEPQGKSHATGHE